MVTYIQVNKWSPPGSVSGGHFLHGHITNLWSTHKGISRDMAAEKGRCHGDICHQHVLAVANLVMTNIAME